MVDPEFHIDTPRLVISYLDPTKDAHCDFIVTLQNSPSSLASIKGYKSPTPDRESARKQILDNDPTTDNGYGRYLVSLKTPTLSPDASSLPFSQRSDTYTIIGVVTMKLRKFENSPLAPDVGYGLLDAFQGKGYATEAARALVTYFEESLGRKEFFGFCNPENEGSKGVLRRLGFEERGVRDVKGVKPDGGIVRAMVFSKGLTKELEAYGL